MVTIRRYRNNRKLYDTARSRYVTLDHVAELIRRGEPVRVVDSESDEDLTAVTLAQILFESERVRARLSPALLADLIRRGGRSRPQSLSPGSLPRDVEQRLRSLLRAFADGEPVGRELRALDGRVRALETRLRMLERQRSERTRT
jgi:polyhydroxyalkanoate synthesis repressor PhaR